MILFTGLRGNNEKADRQLAHTIHIHLVCISEGELLIFYTSRKRVSSIHFVLLDRCYVSRDSIYHKYRFSLTYLSSLIIGMVVVPHSEYT